MPLEHFGAPRLSDSGNKRAPRPLSEPGIPDARGASVNRAASDAHAMKQARERIRSERRERNEDDDSAVLSKLTGVSRSVSWGRAEANTRAPTQSALGLQTPKTNKIGSTRTPSGSRLRSHHATASLSMSPSVSSNDLPNETDSQSQKSSPASSAALSLRSLSSLSRHGSLREQDTSFAEDYRSRSRQPSNPVLDSPSPRELQRPIVLSPRLDSSQILSPETYEAPDLRKAAPEPPPTVSVTQERLDRALPPLPTVDLDPAEESQSSPVPALDLAVPVSPRSRSSTILDRGERISRPALYSSSSSADLSLPLLERRGVQEVPGLSSGHDMLQFNVARKHAGSFQTRLSTQPMSQSLHSLPSEDVSNDTPSGGGDGRSRTRLTRFFSRLFNEPRSTSTGSDTESNQSFSPHASIAATSPNGASHPIIPREGGRSPLSDTGPQRTPYTSTTSLMQLASSQILPRPARSPMFGPIPTQDDDLSDLEELQDIHGLTPRSSTPARNLSPAVSRHTSVANAAVPLAQPTPQLKTPITEELTIEPRSHTIEDYDIGNDMGSGAYGFVRRARLLEDPPDAEDVVIKYIVKSCILADSWRRHRTYGTIPAEIFVLLQLQHTPYTPPPNPPPWIKDKAHWMHVRQELLAKQQRGEATGHPGICKLLDFFEDEEYYYLVMPRFGDGHDLFDYVESSTYGLDPTDIRNFLGQVCDVIAYMHANNIVHRDIKDENVILDRFGMTQLIDFGSAARLRANRKFDTFSGTMDYAAAEIIQGEKYSGPPQDVWAFGVTAYVLVCGECPFRNAQEATTGLIPESRPMQVLKHFCFEERQSSTDSFATSHSNHSSEDRDGGGNLKHLFDLVCQCLKLEPDQRPTAAELLHHRFLVGGTGWLGGESRCADPHADQVSRPMNM